MTNWLDRLAPTLLDATLAAMAITSFVILAMIQCRQPARRQVWARAGLLSTLALIPLAALNPVPRIDLFRPISLLFADTQVEPAEIELSGRTDGRVRPACAPLEDCVDASVHVPPILRLAGRFLVFTYLLGLLVGLAWIGLGLWGVSRLISRGASPSDSALRLYESLNFSRSSIRPRLLVSERAARPVLVSLLRPAILIPIDLDRPESMDRLRLGLLHELAHVENLDHRFSPMATIAQTLWFFLPTLWWIRDRMKLDQEFLADRRAVSHFGTSGTYASSLVDLAASGSSQLDECSKNAIVPTNSIMPVVASALFQRIQMLLKCPFPIEGETPRWWRWSTTLTLIMATLAASCLTIRGLGDWWGPVTLASPDTHVFRLGQLVVTPIPNQDQPFEFPYHLPDEFTLTLEILAEPADLPQIEILGYRLDFPATKPEGSEVYRLWHRVQIRRLSGFEFVQLDEKSLPPKFSASPPSRLLTIRPLPGQPTRIRDLTIEW